MAGFPRSEVESRGIQLGLDFICAAAMLVRTEVFESVGLLNEQFFMYFEELDLCSRLGDRKQIGWCPSSFVVHSGGASTGQSREGLKKRQYHENLSALKFTAMHHRACLASVLLGRFLAKPLLFLARRQFFLFGPWLGAFRSFFKWRRREAGSAVSS
jgi:GT2 family glycosyltransferase